MENLLNVGLDWYVQLNKPTSNTETWTVNSCEIHGGPMHSVSCSSQSGYNFYYLNWWYSKDQVGGNGGSDSSSQGYYVAVIRAEENGEAKVTTELPTNVGDISYMTISQLFTAIGGSANQEYSIRCFRADGSIVSTTNEENKKYANAIYKVYGYCDSQITTSGAIPSGSEKIKNYTKFKNCGVWDSSNKMFGGGLIWVNYSPSNGYAFAFFYSGNDSGNSRDYGRGWSVNGSNNYVSGDTWVAVKRVLPEP